MIRNLLIAAIRNLRKNKFSSALNILGLGIGMAVFLVKAAIANPVKSLRTE